MHFRRSHGSQSSTPSVPSTASTLTGTANPAQPTGVGGSSGSTAPPIPPRMPRISSILPRRLSAATTDNSNNNGGHSANYNNQPVSSMHTANKNSSSDALTGVLNGSGASSGGFRPGHRSSSLQASNIINATIDSPNPNVARNNNASGTTSNGNNYNAPGGNAAATSAPVATAAPRLPLAIPTSPIDMATPTAMASGAKHPHIPMSTANIDAVVKVGAAPSSSTAENGNGSRQAATANSRAGQSQVPSGTNTNGTAGDASTHTRTESSSSHSVVLTPQSVSPANHVTIPGAFPNTATAAPLGAGTTPTGPPASQSATSAAKQPGLPSHPHPRQRQNSNGLLMSGAGAPTSSGRSASVSGVPGMVYGGASGGGGGVNYQPPENANPYYGGARTTRQSSIDSSTGMAGTSGMMTGRHGSLAMQGPGSLASAAAAIPRGGMTINTMGSAGGPGGYAGSGSVSPGGGGAGSGWISPGSPNLARTVQMMTQRQEERAAAEAQQTRRLSQLSAEADKKFDCAIVRGRWGSRSSFMEAHGLSVGSEADCNMAVQLLEGYRIMESWSGDGAYTFRMC